MAISFYLNNTQIYPETNTTLTERVGTFSDGYLPLEFSNIKNAFLPMSELKITDSNTNWLFVIISDDVEVVQKTQPVMYKHNLTVRSKIYETTKHIARNTTFSQPMKDVYGEINFVVGTITPTSSSDNFNYLQQYYNSDQLYSLKTLYLNSRTKIKSAKLKVHSTLYIYRGTIFDTPDATLTNAHNDGVIRINRYDGDTLIGWYDVSITNQTEINIDIANIGIFQNIQDNTAYKLYNRTINNFRFNVGSGSNKGCLGLFNARLELETYYYSLYDIADLLYKQNKKYYNGANTNDIRALKLANSLKNGDLRNIIAPEVSFTGQDYYNCLYSLFSYIDAIPVVDGDGYLTYEYLNNNNQSSVQIDKSDEKITLTDEYFTNKLVANYQRGRQDNSIIYPARDRYVRATSKNYGIPSSSDYILRLPKPIDYIDKVTLYNGGDITVNIQCLFENTGGTEKIFAGIKLNKVDISNRVFESSIYETLNDADNEYQNTTQLSNCLSYVKGSDYIDLMGNAAFTLTTQEIYKRTVASAIYYQFGYASVSERGSGNNFEVTIASHGDIANKQNLRYEVEYHAIYDGKVEQVSTTSKYEGETYANQETSSVSLSRMGNNLQGLIAKVGNQLESISLPVSSYGSRMRAGSLWVDDDGNRYIANVVKTTFSTSADNVIVEAQFSKNFNLISQYTKINQEKRFYEISNELTSKGYENITEYMYFSYTDPTSFTFEKSAINSANFMRVIIANTLLITNYTAKCDYATFKPYTNENDTDATFSDYVYIPLHIYGSGNSLCFEMDFDSPINAGNRLTGTGATENPYYTRTTLYTGDNGFADKVDISLWYSNSTGGFGENFPRIATIPYDSELLKLEGFRYYKKPNEIFHLNYALAFMSDPNDEFFFGNKYIEQNNIIPTAVRSKQVKFKYGNGQYSIIDNKVLDNQTEATLQSLTYTQYTNNDRYYGIITITPTSSISCKCWALVDENDNILIASNKELENSSTINIYVIPRRKRI